MFRRMVPCSDTPRSSGWVRWKADNFLLRFKKNPDEKYFFIMEKFDFEKLFIENFQFVQSATWCLLKEITRYITVFFFEASSRYINSLQ